MKRGSGLDLAPCDALLAHVFSLREPDCVSSIYKRRHFFWSVKSRDFIASDSQYDVAHVLKKAMHT